MRPLVILSLFFIVVLSGCTPGRIAPEHEVLIAWGKQEPHDECLVWMVDPAQEVAEQVLNVETCGLKVADINNTPHLIYRSGQMTIYTIHAAERRLSVKEVIALDGIGAIGSPQWDKEGTLYFSSTVEDVEQIFRVNKGSKIVVPFIKNDKGIASGPAISPDGRYLVYWTLDGPTNSFSNPYCVTGCFNGYYHVLDLESNRDISLLSLIRHYNRNELITSHHENAHWSPTGQLLAFQISVRGAGGIIIFDASKSEIVAHLRPKNIGDSMEIVQWISDTELIYMGARHLPESGSSLIWPYSYSLESKSSEELLPNLPTLTDNGDYILFYDFDMTADGDYIVGVLPAISSAERDTVSLFIAEADLELSESYTFYSKEELPYSALSSPFTNPVWSHSGKWISYFSSYPLAGSDNPGLAELYIIARTGEAIAYDERITDIVAPTLQYAWVQSH